MFFSLSLLYLTNICPKFKNKMFLPSFMISSCFIEATLHHLLFVDPVYKSERSCGVCNAEPGADSRRHHEYDEHELYSPIPPFFTAEVGDGSSVNDAQCKF